LAKGSDLIDLSALNASKFIGTGLFSGQAGEVRYATFDGGTIVELDSNGDHLADFQVELNSSVALSFSDFRGLEIDGTAKSGGGKKAGFTHTAANDPQPFTTDQHIDSLHHHQVPDYLVA
jgi:hypothetical protein